MTPTRVLALFGPTASGKTAVADALAELVPAELVSADAAALFLGLGVLTAAPEAPTRLVSLFDVTHDLSVAEFQRLAHAAIDEIVAAGRLAVVVGGSGLYLQAALTELELPPPPAEGARERWQSAYDADPDAAYALLEQLDPAAAAQVHVNDRRRVVRALELADAGASLAGGPGLWDAGFRHQTTIVALDLPDDVLERRIRARAEQMLARGVVDEARAAFAQPLSQSARKVMGLVDFATLPPDEAVEALVRNNRRLARYQRKWLRRLPSAEIVDADRAPNEVAAEIVERAKLAR